MSVHVNVRPATTLHVLGGVMGAAMFIEDFCPIALQYRGQWFPRILEVQSTGGPAGESFSPHGVATSAVDVLRHAVQVVPTASRVDRRDVAIQSLSGYIRRLTPRGEPRSESHPGSWWSRSAELTAGAAAGGAATVF